MTKAASTETTPPTFSESALLLLQAAECSLDRARDSMYTQPSMVAVAAYDLRQIVTAETERHLYREAATADRGEARFVAAVTRYLSAHTRDTDAFARAVTDTQREAALTALRNLRSTMSGTAYLELVNDL